MCVESSGLVCKEETFCIGTYGFRSRTEKGRDLYINVSHYVSSFSEAVQKIFHPSSAVRLHLTLIVAPPP